MHPAPQGKNGSVFGNTNVAFFGEPKNIYTTYSNFAMYKQQPLPITNRNFYVEFGPKNVLIHQLSPMKSPQQSVGCASL